MGEDEKHENATIFHQYVYSLKMWRTKSMLKKKNRMKKINSIRCEIENREEVLQKKKKIPFRLMQLLPHAAHIQQLWPSPPQGCLFLIFSID